MSIYIYIYMLRLWKWLDLLTKLTDSSYALMWHPRGACLVIRSNAEMESSARELSGFSTKSSAALEFVRSISSRCPPPFHLRQLILRPPLHPPRSLPPPVIHLRWTIRWLLFLFLLQNINFPKEKKSKSKLNYLLYLCRSVHNVTVTTS